MKVPGITPDLKASRAEINNKVNILPRQIKAAWERITAGDYPTPTIDVVKEFTTHQYLTRSRFAGADFMKCCAMTLNWNLYVWSQHQVTNTLSINSVVEQAQPSRTVHILLKEDHCELLVPQDGPQADKVRALETEQRAFAVSQQIHTLYEKADVKQGEEDAKFVADLKRIKKSLFLSQK